MPPISLVPGRRPSIVIAAVVYAASVVVTVGCASSDGHGHDHDHHHDHEHHDHHDHDHDHSDASQAEAPESIRLTGALTPTEHGQAVRIEVREQRTTTAPPLPPVQHQFDFTIDGTLSAAEPQDDGTSRTTLAFRHIAVTLGVVGQDNGMLSYDSAVDKPGQGNVLADTMHVVAGATCDLRVSEQGELLELSGLNPLWRRANMILAPPATFTAQWAFRDIAMHELVNEALFPPMPRDPVAPGMTWKSEAPTDIPLTARLVSQRINTLGAPEARDVLLGVSGDIKAAAPLAGDKDPSVQIKVHRGKEHGELAINLDKHTLEQQIESDVTLDLVLKAPAEGKLQQTIERRRTLTASRQPLPARAAMLN